MAEHRCFSRGRSASRAPVRWRFSVSRLRPRRRSKWGLIWKVVEDADLLDEAVAVAQKLADGPPVSIGLIKGQIESAWNSSLASTLDDEASSQARAFVTEDLREGAAALYKNVRRGSPADSGAVLPHHLDTD